MNETRDLFRSLRESDRNRAPSFASTIASARRAPRPVRASVLPAAAAVAAGVAIALAVVPRFGDDGSLQAAIARAREMSAWSAPTAVFEPSDDSLLDSTPSLSLSSVPLPE
jgi:hypothetical protein